MELAGTIKLGAFGWCNTVNGPGRDGRIGREIGGSVILTLKWFYIIYNIA